MAWEKVQRENGLGEIFTRVPKDTGSGSLKARMSKYVVLLTREVLPQNRKISFNFNFLKRCGLSVQRNTYLYYLALNEAVNLELLT